MQDAIWGAPIDFVSHSHSDIILTWHQSWQNVQNLRTFSLNLLRFLSTPWQNVQNCRSPPVLLLIPFTSSGGLRLLGDSLPPTPDCLVSLRTPGSHSPIYVIYMCPLFPIVLVSYCYHVCWSCEHMWCCFGLHATCYCALVLRVSSRVLFRGFYTSLFFLGGENKTHYYIFLRLSPIIMQSDKGFLNLFRLAITKGLNTFCLKTFQLFIFYQFVLKNLKTSFLLYGGLYVGQ